MVTDRSLEADLLYAIGYFDPVEYHKLRRILEEWRNREIEWDEYEQARENLAELDLIVTPSIEDRSHRLTDRGWKVLKQREADGEENIEAGPN